MKWNTDLYDNNHDYVSRFGNDVLSWLKPQQDERVLDVGCGTGELAEEIRSVGADVVGIDSSPDMIDKARANYPGIEFEVRDAADFTFEKPFDAVFSNATLHWVPKAQEAAERIFDALKPGGRFVFEMGGKYNILGIRNAIKQAAGEQGENVSDSFWYFPSLSEYSAVLEQSGFTVQDMSYFERDTPLKGEDGMRNWIEQFGGDLLGNIPETAKAKIVAKAIEKLKPTHLREDGWHADYVRLRGKAVKPQLDL